MIFKGKKIKKRDIKDKLVEIFKNEYFSFIIAVLSFGVSKNNNFFIELLFRNDII